METLGLAYLLHIDQYLSPIVAHYGVLAYLVLFFIIFLETGLVIAPFLPGDSLLFTAGAFAGVGALNVYLLFFILSLASIAGDFVNYQVGYWLGRRLLARDKIRLIKKEHLYKTHDFYEKYGAKTIIIARFVPVIRTIAPFVAGVARMSYRQFLFYNIIGGVLWAAIFIFGGYFFGNLPVVQKNFSAFILGIIVLSFVPAIIGYWRHRK